MLEPYKDLEEFGYNRKSGKGTRANKHYGLDFIVNTMNTINKFNVKREYYFIGSLDVIFRLAYDFGDGYGQAEAIEYKDAIKDVADEYKEMGNQRELHRQFLSLVKLEEIDSLYFVGFETHGRPIFTNNKKYEKDLQR